MKRNSAKNIFIAFVLNLFFSIFELIGGILTNSISIISDSIHDFGDAISILISLILEKKSRKKPNQDYTFGYLRYSTIGALITCSILFIGSIYIIFTAVNRIINPIEVNYDGMFLLSIVGIIINVIATKITSHSNNLNEKTISLHMLEDVLGWVCILAGSIIIKFTNFYVIDPVSALCVSLFILVNVIKRYKNIFEILLEKKPSKINIEELKKQLLEIEEIKDIHHFHIWTIDGITNYITLHVLVSDDTLCKDLEKIKKKINEELEKHDIGHSTIEFETVKCYSSNCENNNKVDISIHNHRY